MVVNSVKKKPTKGKQRVKTEYREDHSRVPQDKIAEDGRKNTSEENLQKDPPSTKLDIFYGFEKALLSMPYKRMTVKDICREAHVSRPTFYRYYRNKDDIVFWLAKEALRSGIAQVGRGLSWFEGNYYTTAVYAYYSDIFNKVQSDSFSFEIASACSEYLNRELHATLIERNAIINGVIRFQIDSFCLSQCFNIQKWIIEENRTETKTFAKYLTSIVPADLLFLMKEKK